MSLLLRAGRRLTSGLLVAFSLGLGLAMLAPPLLHMERYVITGASMTGSIARGSVVWEQQVPVSSLRAGDVITYQPPAAAHHDGLVTHRILSIRRGADGRLGFRTQGDANAAPDPWSFTLDRPTQPRVVAHAPYLGYAIAALTDRRIRMVVVGVPALLIAGVVLAGLWRDEQRERRGVRTGTSDVAAAA